MTSHFFRFSPLMMITVFLLGALLPLSAAVAAGPIYWDWPADRHFEDLQMQGTALDAQGALVAGVTGTTVGPAGAEVCWCSIGDGHGGFFTGTGHGGEIHHTDRKGHTALFARLDGAEIFCLSALPDGGLLAGCGPDGQLFRVDAHGYSKQLGNIPGGYIWALEPDPDGRTWWLATGSPAALHKYSPADGLQQVVSFPAENALDLLLDEDGSLLLCTQGPGLVYRLDPRQPDSNRLICETTQNEVRQLLRGPQGALFFLALADQQTSSPDKKSAPAEQNKVPAGLLALLSGSAAPKKDKAALFRLEPGDGYSPYWAGNEDLMIVAWNQRWGWLGGGALDAQAGLARLYQLNIPAGQQVLATWSGGDILDLSFLAADGSRPELLVSQAHPGNVRRLVQGGEDLMAFSPPLDAGRPVSWGRLHWQASRGAGKLRWSVRGGNRSEPDASWTPWSGPWTDEDHRLDLPDSRFLQWRVQMPEASRPDDDSWRITAVSVSAWRQNASPVIRDFTIEKVSDISRGTLMSMPDNVTQRFDSGLKVEFSKKSTASQEADPRRGAATKAVRVMTWQGWDPDGDRLSYRLEYRREGSAAWRPILDQTPELLGSWDTSVIPDGSYEVRLTVSDRPDNPGTAALSDSRTAGPLLVDNTAPQISGLVVSKVPAGIRLSCRARDEASLLALARVQLPDGRRQRLDPVDKVCDSHGEKFDTVIPWPQQDHLAGKEPWILTVEVWDLAGNMARSQGVARD